MATGCEVAENWTSSSNPLNVTVWFPSGTPLRLKLPELSVVALPPDEMVAVMPALPTPSTVTVPETVPETGGNTVGGGSSPSHAATTRAAERTRCFQYFIAFFLREDRINPQLSGNVGTTAHATGKVRAG